MNLFDLVLLARLELPRRRGLKIGFGPTQQLIRVLQLPGRLLPAETGDKFKLGIGRAAVADNDFRGTIASFGRSFPLFFLCDVTFGFALLSGFVVAGEFASGVVAC